MSGDDPPTSGPRQQVEELVALVLGAAVEVHRELGPGFAETVYERALDIELTERGIPFTRQASVRVTYRGRVVGDLRLDLLVADRLVVELKAIDCVTVVHLAQALSYLKATRLPLALVINFNVPILLRGVRRVVLSRRPTL
jgi:GxxExxY protein